MNILNTLSFGRLIRQASSRTMLWQTSTELAIDELGDASMGIEENVGLSLKDAVDRGDSNTGVVAVQPTPIDTVQAVRRVVSRARSTPFVHHHARQVVQVLLVGGGRWQPSTFKS